MSDTAGLPSRDGPLTGLHSWLGLGAFSIFVVIGVATRVSDHVASSTIGAAVAMAAAIPLFVRRPSFPLVYAVIATGGVAALDGVASQVGWFALAVLAAWCVLSGGVRVGVAYWVASMLVFGGEWLFGVRDPGWADWAAGVTFTFLAAMLVRYQLVLVERLRVAQDGLAERSRAEERNRIAGELHDVIAHNLTVSLLHVTSARLAVEHDPADAARALGEAERLGRQSLAEVRATMGMLRLGSPHPGVAPESVVAPMPGIVEVPRLVAQVRNAGADVSIQMDGDLSRVPATTGAMIYRVVQEALTNAVRHAPGCAVLVDVAVQTGCVEVNVDSAGVAGHGSGGMGLAGMTERAQAVGGTCSAGPGGRGWLVHASVPLGTASERGSM